jgi:hypothetical protein
VKSLWPADFLEIDGDTTLEYYNKATYSLDEVHELLRKRRCIVTQTAVNGAVAVGYASKEEVIERVLKLRKSEIYKTMTADKADRLWQDVYKTKDENGRVLYIKVQINHEQKAVVIQFKESD